MYKVKIESMNCMSCVHNIEDALKEVDADVQVDAELKNKLLNIESSKLSDVEVKKIIEDAGYPVK